MEKNKLDTEKNADKKSARDVQKELVEYFMRVQEGERILSIRELASLLKMSVGAISIVLNNMQDMGAVTIEKHGHMGSCLAGRSVSKLWELSGRGPMVIATSLPMHIRFEGLAAGVKKTLEKAGIETYLIFIRGSQTRLKALHDNRCDTVLMSGLSAERIDKSENEVMHILPPTTWLSGYGVFYRTSLRDKDTPLRVGVDFQSSDNMELTRAVFAGKKIELKYVSYIHITRLLMQGELDAIVWNTDQMHEMLSPAISYKPIPGQVAQDIGQKVLSAHFIGKRGDSIVKTVLKELIDPEEVMAIQKKVVDREILPEY